MTKTAPLLDVANLTLKIGGSGRTVVELLASLAPDQPVFHRIGALGLLCFGGLAAYALAGWLLGAFGALPLRKRRG